MKKIISFLICTCISINITFAQADPVLLIDGVSTTFREGLSLPYWLKSGQTIGFISGIKSASILEFFEDNGNLKYSQTIALTSTQTVPLGKVWKIEGLGLGINGMSINGFSNDSLPSIFTSPKTFSAIGDFTWKVPPSVTNFCIEVWGPGGRGFLGIGAGGGGGYGYQCFDVVPGTIYTVHLGDVWGGDSTSFGNLIVAYGGSNPTINLNGQGGFSTAIYNINGGNASGFICGNGANGGLGGAPCGAYCNQNGKFPGGGGGADYGVGGVGQVKIFW